MVGIRECLNPKVLSQSLHPKMECCLQDYGFWVPIPNGLIGKWVVSGAPVSRWVTWPTSYGRFGAPVAL